LPEERCARISVPGFELLRGEGLSLRVGGRGHSLPISCLRPWPWKRLLFLVESHLRRGCRCLLCLLLFFCFRKSRFPPMCHGQQIVYAPSLNRDAFCSSKIRRIQLASFSIDVRAATLGALDCCILSSSGWAIRSRFVVVGRSYGRQSEPTAPSFTGGLCGLACGERLTGFVLPDRPRPRSDSVDLSGLA